ncbi:MAG: cation transporter [Alphaproteobacteria bacterium]|nr:cation transporter [Alphaproteobacteria bacterium]
MASGHDHHGHAHGAGQGSERRLLLALALTSAFLVAEVVAGLVFNSLALLSDAAHMFTDSAALAIAVAAVRIGSRASDSRRTFGYRRFEVLAAAFNSVLLFGVAIYIAVEGARRLLEPEPVQSLGMLLVATLGLGINLLAMRLLSPGSEKSLNVKGAYLEVWADMLGSLGVIVGAIVISLTGQTWVDPVVAIAIGLWVLPRTWTLLKDATNILLEGVPATLNLSDLRRAVGQVSGVAGVHDLHVWVSGADRPSCSLHVELDTDAEHDSVRVAICALLQERFHVLHTTVQTEREPCGERSALHP